MEGIGASVALAAFGVSEGASNKLSIAGSCLGSSGLSVESGAFAFAPPLPTTKESVLVTQ